MALKRETASGIFLKAVAFTRTFRGEDGSLTTSWQAEPFRQSEGVGNVAGQRIFVKETGRLAYES